MQSTIATPAGFTPAYATGFADGNGMLSLVSSSMPLPVTVTPSGGTLAAAVAGTSAASILTPAFSPTPGVPVIVTLDGAWTGTVVVQRSADGGMTRRGLTVAGDAWARFTGNACEPVWEEHDPSAALYLDIALTSGSVTYRLGH
ncbi:MAG: hypothetical protein KGL48_03380 [Sphingomonadales bacterium]|nr:hypothetical protein [Sphingomonadales bacterium]MDE2567942.1 hypothetical protein [Sphingomonadales bacterium]